jgi:hypothetical protein
MDWDQWDIIVGELNISYRHQEIEPLTARAWFRTLEPYPAPQVARAAARCVGTAEFISCYAIVQAIKDEQREYQANRSTVLPLPARGVPMPPETKEAIAVLKRSKLLPGHPNYLTGPEARQRIDQLAGYLDARLAERTTAPRRDHP